MAYLCLLDGLNKVPQVAILDGNTCQDLIRRLTTVLAALIYE
jgi:hypothetical protein